MTLHVKRVTRQTPIWSASKQLQRLVGEPAVEAMLNEHMPGVVRRYSDRPACRKALRNSWRRHDFDGFLITDATESTDPEIVYYNVDNLPHIPAITLAIRGLGSHLHGIRLHHPDSGKVFSDMTNLAMWVDPSVNADDQINAAHNMVDWYLYLRRREQAPTTLGCFVLTTPTSQQAETRDPAQAFIDTGLFTPTRLRVVADDQTRRDGVSDNLPPYPLVWVTDIPTAH